MITGTPATRTLDQIIGANLKALRESRKDPETGRPRSQARLAQQLGCSRHHIMQLEGKSGGEKSGGRRPSFTAETLVALCGIFDCGLWELLIPMKEGEDGARIPADEISVRSQPFAEGPEKTRTADHLSQMLFGAQTDELHLLDNARELQKKLFGKHHGSPMNMAPTDRSQLELLRQILNRQEQILSTLEETQQRERER